MIDTLVFPILFFDFQLSAIQKNQDDSMYLSVFDADEPCEDGAALTAEKHQPHLQLACSLAGDVSFSSNLMTCLRTTASWQLPKKM